jgi:uncharacterized membrane protein YgdD (TMEM256/DUF423 family)
VGPAAIAVGALYCGLSIVGGAFGAHALRGRLDPGSLALWETAARYLMYAGFALVLVGLAGHQWPRRGFAVAAVALGAGGLVFSGTVAALALGSPRWLGAVTPLGGLAMIAGFFVFAWTAFRLTA